MYQLAISLAVFLALNVGSSMVLAQPSIRNESAPEDILVVYVDLCVLSMGVLDDRVLSRLKTFEEAGAAHELSETEKTGNLLNNGRVWRLKGKPGAELLVHYGAKQKMCNVYVQSANQEKLHQAFLNSIAAMGQDMGAEPLDVGSSMPVEGSTQAFFKVPIKDAPHDMFFAGTFMPAEMKKIPQHLLSFSLTDRDKTK